LPLDSRERRENRNFLTTNFLLSVSFIGIIVYGVGIMFLLMHTSTIFVLLKAFLVWGVILVGKYGVKTLKKRQN